MAEDTERNRKRLKYRSAHRGTKELDLLLGSFAERHLDAMDAAQLRRFEAILEADEHDIYGWISGNRPVPPQHDNEVMRMIRRFEFRSTWDNRKESDA